MSRWRISRGQAIDLQDWALEESGTKELLNKLPELPEKDKIKPGLYVSYEIDPSELDGWLDWPDVGVARVFAVLTNGHKEYLGEVRAYNWEAIWLSTNEYDEVDDAEEWWKCIKDDYEKLKNTMPPHKEYRKEKEIQIQDFSLNEKLRALSNKDMYDLVQTLLNKNPEVRKSILEWFMDESKDMKNINRKQVRRALDEELLWERWYDAKPIISQFNEYGGGSEDEEDECYSYLDDIEELAKNGEISTKAKFEFMDELFEEYNVGNSGFEDKMMDICFALCKTKEEWEYLVKKLGENPTDWRRDLIMEIQKKHLQDDDAYLKMRKEDLHYGMDYWDLAGFYIGKGERKKAVEISEEGLLKGDGRLTELFEFLSDYYAKSRDTANLERVVQYAIKKKSDEKEMLDRLFEYYKAENDYENAKRALLKEFEYVKPAGYIPEVRSYAHYNKMKQFLAKADWKDIEPKIIREVREKDLEDYIRICLDKNMKKEVVDILLNPPKKRPGIGFVFEEKYDFDEFAKQLKEEFPEDIIKYYWQKAYSNIQNGNRDTYRIAARYLGMVKNIYIDILNEESKWEQRFSNLKVEFKKRPAFLEEVREL